MRTQPTKPIGIRDFAGRFGRPECFDDQDVETLHYMVEQMQHNFGMTRIKLGALLLSVKHHELWAGRAQNFGEYLESLKIQPLAARQYMIVAENLIFRLKLNSRQLESAARASMTTLVTACGIMTTQNADEVISILETLSDRDAKHVLRNFDTYHEPLQQKEHAHPRISKLAREFYELPNDLRLEFMQRIGINR